MGTAIIQQVGKDSIAGRHSITFTRTVYVGGDMEAIFVSGTETESEVVETFRRIVTDRLEDVAFSSLSEPSFADDWNSEEDAIYDDL